MLTAARLAEAGYAVVASMRTPAKSNTLKAELDRRRTTAEVLQLDVTSSQSVTNAMAHLQATGGLDVLINNAGVQGQGFLEYLDDETFKRVFETNFFGLVRTTRAALPLLRESPKARIINISSLAVLPAILLGQRIRQANGRSRASAKVCTTSCCPSGFRSVWWSPEATKPRSTDRTHNIRALPLAASMHPCKRRSTSHISPCRAATRRILPMPFWTSCAIRRRHFVRARVMMYAGFIDCGVRCRFPLSVRCSGAGHLLILRE